MRSEKDTIGVNVTAIEHICPVTRYTTYDGVETVYLCRDRHRKISKNVTDNDIESLELYRVLDEKGYSLFIIQANTLKEAVDLLNSDETDLTEHTVSRNELESIITKLNKEADARAAAERAANPQKTAKRGFFGLGKR